jgi:DNA polymerase-3 subunit delta
MERKNGDAHILITAPLLSPRSSLRKLFESSNNVYIAPIFDDPPSQEEVAAEIKTYNLPHIEQDALEQLLYLGQSLSPGEFSQTLEKISLYKVSNSSSLTYTETKELAPYLIEAGIEEATNIIAEGRTSEVGPLLKKLESQGINLVHICVSTTTHFKKLYRVSNDSSGPEMGIRNLKPPVPFNKSARLLRQVKSWNSTKLSSAINLLFNLDIELRSNSNAPNNARVERAMIRLSLISRR